MVLLDFIVSRARNVIFYETDGLESLTCYYPFWLWLPYWQRRNRKVPDNHESKRPSGLLRFISNSGCEYRRLNSIPKNCFAKAWRHPHELQIECETTIFYRPCTHSESSLVSLEFILLIGFIFFLFCYFIFISISFTPTSRITQDNFWHNSSIIY